MQRQELLQRDAENSYLAADEGPMDQLLGRSITYRMAIGLQRGCKVFTLETLPESDPYEPFADTEGDSPYAAEAGSSFLPVTNGKLPTEPGTT